MENILQKWLTKVGVKDYSGLTDLEKETYKQWEKILNKEVRIDDVAKFMQSKVNQLNKDLREALLEGDDRLALFISAKIDNYETLILFIKEPLARKANLERELLGKL